MSADIPSLLSTPRQNNRVYFPDHVEESDRTWTAVRCDTLISTLKSRIDLLQQDGNQFLPPITATTQAHSQYLSPDILKVKRRNGITYGKRSRRGKEETKDHAPAASKTGTISPHAPIRAPGEAWGATPLISRSISTTDISQQSPTIISNSKSNAKEHRQNVNLRLPVFQPGPSAYQLKQVLKQARTKLPADQYDISMRICESYQALLRAAKMSGSEPKPSKSKSLLFMCLRAMPARMELEQTLYDLEAKATGMKLVTAARSSEMYSEIREMDLSGEGGTHIKTILRAHGTAIISNAIRDRVLCLEFGTVAVMNCIQMSCIDEGRVLMETAVRMIEETAPTSFYSQPSPAFSFLLSCITSNAEYFRVLTSMFLHNRLPISWLATKHLQSMWPRLFAALTGKCHCADVEEFLKIILPKLSAASNSNISIEGTSITNTFASLLSNLCFMVMMRTWSQDNFDGESFAGIDAVLRCFANSLLSSSDDHQQVLLAIFITMLVRPIDASPPSMNIPDVLATIDADCPDHCKSVTGVLSTITCSILGRCERAGSGDGARMVKQVVRLMDAVPASPPSVSHVLWTAVVNGISAFSRHLPNGSAAAEVKEITRTLCSRLGLKGPEEHVSSPGSEQRGSGTPEVKRSMKHLSGCRWEEGIGEWVATTPSSVKPETQEEYLPPFISEYCESPSVPHRMRFQPRVPYMSTHKRSASRTQGTASFLDLVPSSPDGSDTEPESSILTGTSTYLDRHPSPREDLGFRDRPRKFLKLDVPSIVGPAQHRREPAALFGDGSRNEGHGESNVCIENPFAWAQGRACVRMRTPFPASDTVCGMEKSAEGSMHDIESSGDELG